MKITREDLVPISVLNSLTGTYNKEAQKCWLAENHIKFLVDIKGRPRVHADEFKRVLVTEERAKVVPIIKAVPNWDAFGNGQKKKA